MSAEKVNHILFGSEHRISQEINIRFKPTLQGGAIHAVFGHDIEHHPGIIPGHSRNLLEVTTRCQKWRTHENLVRLDQVDGIGKGMRQGPSIRWLGYHIIRFDQPVSPLVSRFVYFVV